jgi:hypothetical protein
MMTNNTSFNYFETLENNGAKHYTILSHQHTTQIGVFHCAPTIQLHGSEMKLIE